MMGTQTSAGGSTPYGTYQKNKENQADAVIEPEAIDLDFDEDDSNDNDQQPKVAASSTPNMAPIGANPFESQSSLDKPATNGEEDDDDEDDFISLDSVRGPATNF